MGELTRARAYELAERLLEVEPWVCRVNIFEEEDGSSFAATITVELGDPSGADLAALSSQLDRLRSIAEAEGVRLTTTSTLGFRVDTND
jgi:hypothetical protein